MRILLMTAVATLTSFGCASSQASDKPTTPQSGDQSHSGAHMAKHRGMEQAGDEHGGMMGHGDKSGSCEMDSCPMMIVGTSVHAEDVAGGAALAFTTTGDVNELRRRIAHMAEMHGKMAEMHGKHHGGSGGGMGMHAGKMSGHDMMPAADVRVEEIEGGARLIFTAREPSELPALREHAQQHAAKMSSGECAMMKHHGGDAPAP